MDYKSNITPGLGDPYWYEWSVGELYILDMLNEDNKIASVQLQAEVSLGLDDVVVTYANGETLFLQVKNTRTNNFLTFGDLVEHNAGKYSLLEELATSWYKEKGKYQKTRVCLFTNKKAGIRASSVRAKGSSDSSPSAGEKFSRPALENFLSDLNIALSHANKISDIHFPEYERAWEEWVSQLSSIDSEEDKILFLKCLEINPGEPDLDGIKAALLKKIRDTFATGEGSSEDILGKLDHAMRTWVTSSRNSPHITAENVMDALSFTNYSITYNHDLIPNEPFFESRNIFVQTIEEKLRSGPAKVIFLSGAPGTGKTNLISKLGSKRDSVIDIRYHAYEPIDPAKEYLPMDVSQRVDKDYFWNELFNQLRKCLKGHLHKYHVPVINSLMSGEEMRRRFFELASAYASDLGRNFIVAIDGIDHAARAGNTDQTFLATLPNPEYIPENVKVILSGQPKENYSAYPLWLFSKSEEVDEIFVPELAKSDIQSLVYAKFPNLQLADQIQLTELIAKYAQGNTLAAIFAIHEALQQSNLQKLEEQLIHRKLSGNIEEYYKNIWDAAIKSNKIPFLEYKIAGVLAFFNEPIEAEKLRAIYPAESVSVSDWGNVLRALRPLVVEKNAQYTLLHNDIRVFLSGIINREKEHVQEVYSSLCDYYLNRKEKSPAYYNDIFRFLCCAGRINEFEAIYSPSFLIEAYVNGVELTDLHNMSNDIMTALLAQDTLNWESLRHLAFGYLTLDQIKKSRDEIEDCSFRRVNPYVPVSSYECYVESNSSWNSELISNVLQMVDTLYVQGHEDRAINLFNRWFAGLKTADIIRFDAGDDNALLSPTLNNTAVLLAKSICLTNSWNILDDIDELYKNHENFAYRLIESFIDNLIATQTGSVLADVLGNMKILLLLPLFDALNSLLSSNRYSDIAYLARTLRCRLSNNSLGVMLITFMEAITEAPILDAAKKEDLWRQIDEPDLLSSVPDFEREEFFYCVYAILSGYLRPFSYLECAKDVTSKYIDKHTHCSTSYFTVYFNNLCFIGKWLSLSAPESQTILRPCELRDLMKALLEKKWSPNATGYSTRKQYSHIVKAYIQLSRNSVNGERQAVDEVCENLFKDNPVDDLMDAGIFYYKDNPERLNQWLDYWTGSNGIVWRYGISERNPIIKRIETMIAKYGLVSIADFEATSERAMWSVIGYVSHKEYSLDYLLDWYNSLTTSEHNRTKYLEKIKKLSDQIDELGDNRISYPLNNIFYKDIFECNFQWLKHLLSNSHYLTDGIISPDLFISGLAGHLSSSELSKQTILELWAIGTALLDWRNDDDRSTIDSLQHAVLICAERYGYTDVCDEISRLSPAYFNPQIKGKTAHTPEPKKNVIDDYLSGDSIIRSKSQLWDEIKLLRERSIADNEYCANILSYELEHQEYNLYHNTLVENLVRVLPAELVDQIIKEYLLKALQESSLRLSTDLPLLVLWKTSQEGDTYRATGIEELLYMYNTWVTASGHFPEPILAEKYNYSAKVDWDKVTDIGTLFYQIIQLIIISNDADAVRIAISGLFSLLRVNSSYINYLETDWSKFHYRAREWLMMIYELLWYMEPSSRESILSCVKRHCTDENFNVALYANIFLQNIMGDSFSGYLRQDQKYFSEIPTFGNQQFLIIANQGQTIDGANYVSVLCQLIQIMIGANTENIEKQTLSYSKMLNNIELIPLQRMHPAGGCKVAVDTVTLAFLRVMYREWFNGRWDESECDLARIILSATEPYALLYTPSKWPYNSGTILSNTTKFPSLSNDLKKAIIFKVLQTGIADGEIVIAGSIIEYTYKKVISGFKLCYLDFPHIKNTITASEQNSRLLLQCRSDFIENCHQNITLHCKGIASFQLDNILCGFSKTALDVFGWSIVLCSNGLMLEDKTGHVIGRFESFYGNHGEGNRYAGNQPIIQRWVISADALACAEEKCPRGASIKLITNVHINSLDNT